MKIQLKSWLVADLSIHAVSGGNKSKNDNSFGLRTGQKYSETNAQEFHVTFEIEIHDEHFDLKMKAVFSFETDSAINESFKISDFPKINAPAIAFPYLRAYISNLTLQSGYEPIILPSINFVELTREGN
jgi:preprotein translocase subunit SecB